MPPSSLNFDEINDITGFANGEMFRTENEVREYFTPESIAEMFGSCEMGVTELHYIGEKVLNNEWHCDF